MATQHRARSTLSDLSGLVARVERLDPSPKVISLDVFDTLLCRLARPRRVADLACRALARDLRRSGGSELALEWLLEERLAFAEARADAARRARNEWSIVEWYRWLAAHLGVAADDMIERGLTHELDAEFCLTAVRHGAAEALAALAKDHRVIAVSDSQLPEEVLVELLARHGVELDAVYSSASVDKTKRGGALFDHVLDAEGVDAARLLHVGDNFKSDVVRAAGAGCHFYWTPAPTAQSPDEICHALSRPRAPKGAGDLYRLCFEQLAPIVALFTIWQWRLFRASGVEQVGYIAREGQVLLHAYDLLAGIFDDSPPRHYLELSRRAVALAHPADLLQRGLSITGKTSRRTLADFMSQFWLPEELRERIFAASELSADSPLTQRTRARLRRGLDDCDADIEREQRRQRALLGDYLRQKLGEQTSRVALVDSGWAGTTQDAVQAVLPEARLVLGTYLGVSGQGLSPDRRNQKHGLLWDAYNPSDWSNPLEQSAGVIRVWELLLASQAPTVTHLERREDNSVAPVLARPAEATGRSQALEQIRLGTLDGIRARLDTVRALVRLGEQWPLDAWAAAAAAGSRRLTCFPDREAARSLLELNFEDNLVGGSHRSLDLAGLSLKNPAQGIAWFPGVLAKYGLAPLQPVLEYLARLASKHA